MNLKYSYINMLQERNSRVKMSKYAELVLIIIYIRLDGRVLSQICLICSFLRCNFFAPIYDRRKS